MSTRRLTAWGCGILLGLMITAGDALAHGGQYQGPPRAQPKPGSPRPGGPRGGGLTGGTHPTWQNWWFHNREEFLDVRQRRIAQSGDQEEGQYQPTGHQQATRGEVRDKIIPVIVKMLGHHNADVRDAACIALGRCGSAPEVAALIPLVNDAKDSVREAAIMGLGLLKDARAEAALVAVLESPDTRFKERGMAAVALGMSGGKRAKAALTEKLGQRLALGKVSRVKQKQLEGCRALGLALIGDPADLATIMNAVRKGSTKQDNFKPMALTALARMGDPSALTLAMKTLSSRKNEDRRSAAILAGRTLQADQKKDVKKFINALKREKDKHARYYSIISLGRIGDKDALEVLRKTLKKGKNREEQGFAAIALGIARDGESIRLLRMNVEKAKDISLRSASALALGIMDDRPSAQFLHQALGKTGNPDLRAYLITALAMLEYEKAKPDIRAMAKAARNPKLVRACGFALALMRDADALDLILGILKDSGSLTVKGGMASALGRIGDKRVIDGLLKIAKDPGVTDMTRAFAVVALGLVGDKSMTSDFTRVSIDSNYSLVTCEALQEILDIF